MRGRLTEGWPEIEWRWKNPGFPRRMPPYRCGWRQWGTKRCWSMPIRGWATRFSSFATCLRCGSPARARRGAGAGGDDPAVEALGRARSGAEKSLLPRIDAQIALGSLGGPLEITLQTIPAEIPYLAADELLVNAWRQRLSRYGGLKVGIAWQGSTSYGEDRYRSIPWRCSSRWGGSPA